MSGESNEEDPEAAAELLFEKAMKGDHRALGDLLCLFRPRLKQLIEFRMDRRLRQRFDASDVLQEIFVHGARKVASMQRNATIRPYLWMRQIALWRLVDIQREHLGTNRRDPRREASISNVGHSTDFEAQWLVDSMTSPSDVLAREERIRSMRDALDSLEPIDREILSMRHCEQLSRSETAEALGISTAAAAKRYFRALDRIRRAMGAE